MHARNLNGHRALTASDGTMVRFKSQVTMVLRQEAAAPALASLRADARARALSARECPCADQVSWAWPAGPLASALACGTGLGARPAAAQAFKRFLKVKRRALGIRESELDSRSDAIIEHVGHL